MEPGFFLRGLLIGFSIAAPVGPIGVLCIRRTLTDGRLAGLASGLGAASADAIYGSLAGFGLTLVANFLVSQQSWLRLGGGLFLLYLGLKTFLSAPSGEAGQVAKTTSRGLWGAAAWWLLLSGGVSLLRAKVTTGTLRWINRLAGLVIIGFGVAALVL